MMNRRSFLATGLCAALLPGVASAQSLEDTIVAQLSEQGFTHVRITKTWLGRLRFVATTSTRKREIIVNARTGEILRDYSQALIGDDGTTPRIADSGDDDRGSRRSGSGSGGSGSGSSGSGSSGSGSRDDDSSDDDRRDEKDEKDDEEDEKDDDEKDDEEDD